MRYAQEKNFVRKQDIVLGSVNLLEWVEPPKRDIQDLDYSC